MLNGFEFCLHTDFIFGKDAEKQVGTKIKAFSAKKVLMVCGDGKEISPEKHRELLCLIEKEGIDVTEMDGIKANPTLGKIREGIGICKKEGVDFVLGVGGGSVIDTAKAIALGAVYDGDVWDFYSYKKPVEKALPIGAVITYPATGSESSNASVITNEETHQKVGLQAQPLRPVLAFMDPELTYTLPRHLAAAGIADIFSHLAEEYFNAEDTFCVTDHIIEAVFRKLLEISGKCLEEPCDYDAKSELLWIATIANDGLLDVGKVPEWSSHAIGHQLGATYDLNHGVSLAIVMPAWMKYVYRENPKRFQRYAVEVFGVSKDRKSEEEIALEGIAKTKDFFASLGLPVTLPAAGITQIDAREMAKTVLKSKCGEFGSVKKLGVEDIMAIYRLAGQE